MSLWMTGWSALMEQMRWYVIANDPVVTYLDTIYFKIQFFILK
jgi:hypothetical protein